MKGIKEKVVHALRWCKHWHDSQERKYTGEPYYLHPVEVMHIIETVPHTEDMLCAALLHDVVEDTECTLNMIKEKFGDNVASLVEMLTDVSKPSDGNRATRKMIDLNHLKKASPEAKTIKLADLISNTQSIVKYDPGFAKVYLHEKWLLLDLALRQGDKKLWDRANTLLQKSFLEISK